jgi:nucleoside-diphosphate-sugar epimerase
MRVLVTGANGFIGQSFCLALAGKGFFIRAALREARRSANVLCGANEVCTIGNIDEWTDWGEALVGVNAVIHLAAKVHAMSEQHRIHVNDFKEVNTKGTLRLAKMAAHAGVTRFIYLSTIKVNGDQTGNTPFKETDKPLPQDSYAISKWEAEQNLFSIAESTGMEVVVLRPPLVYGPGVKANFNKLLNAIANRLPLPLASVNNHRDFIFIDNLVNAIVTCLTHSRAPGEVFLVSDNEPISTPDLIRMLASAMCKKDRLVPCPVPILRLLGQLLCRSSELNKLIDNMQVDISKIRSTLDWNPPFTLQEGIRKTIRGYRP